MNVIIIEDEKPAVQKLIKGIHLYDSAIKISAALQSNKESIEYLRKNNSPELIFMDIQLNDGLSFEIFKSVEIKSPVIFTTAYDEYLLESFEYNGIDYLLKPIKQEKLNNSLKKYLKLKKHFTANYTVFLDDFINNKKKIKERILVKKGIDYVSIKVDKIAYFFTENKLVFLIDEEGKRYIVDKPLSLLQEEIDNSKFFRVNRKYLVNINSIKKFKPSFKGKIQIEIFPSPGEEIIVSQENASSFKEWIDK